MSEHEGGDNKFISGLLVGFFLGLLIGGTAGGLVLVRNSRVAAEHGAMLEAVQHEAEARGRMRAEELARANERVKELEAKLAGKKE
jgi:hypothetical protein